MSSGSLDTSRHVAEEFDAARRLEAERDLEFRNTVVTGRQVRRP
jgi:hypothetical protein